MFKTIIFLMVLSFLLFGQIEKLDMNKDIIDSTIYSVGELTLQDTYYGVEREHLYGLSYDYIGKDGFLNRYSLIIVCYPPRVFLSVNHGHGSKTLIDTGR